MAKIITSALFVLSLGLNTGYAQDEVSENQRRTFYYDKQADKFLEVPSSRKGVDSLLAISWNSRNTDLRKGLHAARHGLNIAESLQYEAGIARAHYLQGLSYMRLGAHQQALGHYLSALDRETKRGDEERIGKVLNGISIIHLHQENYDQAIEYFKKVIRQFEETGDEERRATGIINLGVVYFRQQKYEESLKYFVQALDICESLIDNELLRMIAITNIGNTYVEVGEYQKGKRYLLQAIDYFDRKGFTRNQSGAYIYLGKLYRRSEKPQLALDYTRRGLQKALSIDNKQYVIDGYEQLAGIYEDQDDYQQAYTLYRQFKAVQDSILNSERSAAINEMQIRFDVEQKNREIELLRKETALKKAQLAQQKLWRNFLVVGLVLFAVIGGLLYRHNNQKKRANLLLEQKNREIEQQNTQLVRLNKKKDEFLGMAAHDLRNPLSGIKSVASLLESEKNMGEEEIQSYVEIIELSADRMVSLINNLLDVSAIENDSNHLKIIALDVPPAIKRTVNSFEKLAEKKEICIETRLESDSMSVWADKEAIQRVLENLISNAIKYSPSGSTVEVAARMKEHRIELLVKDNGPGIPRKEQAKLFKRYGRLSTKPIGNESSTGLGLFIVKNLVEEMDGHVQCESRPGEGAEFIVSLPKVGEEKSLV